MFEKLLNLFRFKSESNEVRYDVTISIDKDLFEQLNEIAVHRGVKAEKEALLFWKIGFFLERAKSYCYYEMKITFKDSEGKEKTISYEELIKFLLKEDE